MFEHKWFRFALGSLGLLVWLALYALTRFGKRDLRQCVAPTRAVAIILLVAWAGFWVTDRERIADVFELNFWGLFFAANWLTRRYRVADASANITSLNLLRGSAPDSGGSTSVR